MADMYDSGLFSELGDLLGHDPTFYEESDVSSLSGGIAKQSFNTFSLEDNYVKSNPQVPEPFSTFPVNLDTSEIDGLLSEGNMLLDKLMSDNGLDPLSAPVDLADVDELIACESKFSSTLIDVNPVGELFARFYEPTGEAYQETPVSPVSTLPSEPSSPVDLFNLDIALSPEPEKSPAVDDQTNRELENLLNSLLDDGASPSNCESMDYYDEQFAPSPTNSSCSSMEYSSAGWEDNSSYSCSPAPEKVKTPKKKKTSTPYSKLPANRKEKKKQQNKEAAIRYRQKKKGESQLVADEEAKLLERNSELKSEVLNLEREIMCMKELLSDVFNVHSI